MIILSIGASERFFSLTTVQRIMILIFRLMILVCLELSISISFPLFHLLILSSQLFLHLIYFFSFFHQVITSFEFMMSIISFIDHHWRVQFIEFLCFYTIVLFAACLVVFRVRIFIVDTFHLFELFWSLKSVRLQCWSYLNNICFLTAHTVADPISYILLVLFYLLSVLF